MKTSNSKVWDVIIFADAFRILWWRRKKEKVLLKSARSTTDFAAAAQAHLEVFDQEGSGHVEDHGVESVGVQGQSVIVVEAVDVHFGQTNLVVGVDGGGVEEVAGAWRNQFWQQMGNLVVNEECQTPIKSDRYQSVNTIRYQKMLRNNKRHRQHPCYQSRNRSLIASPVPEVSAVHRKRLAEGRLFIWGCIMCVFKISTLEI